MESQDPSARLRTPEPRYTIRPGGAAARPGAWPPPSLHPHTRARAWRGGRPSSPVRTDVLLTLLRVTSSRQFEDHPGIGTAPGPRAWVAGPRRLCREHESFGEGGVSQHSQAQSLRQPQAGSLQRLKKRQRTGEEEEEKAGCFWPPSLPERFSDVSGERSLWLQERGASGSLAGQTAGVAPQCPGHF